MIQLPGRKRKKLQESFEYTDIPPRVIIDILSYIGCFIHPPSFKSKLYVLQISGKYGFYGCFRKDRRRNIWMIFTSLYLGSKIDPDNFFVTFRNLRNLALNVGIDVKVIRTIEKIPQFHLLESLKLGNKEYSPVEATRTDPVVYDTLLSEDSVDSTENKLRRSSAQSFRFGSLKKLRIYGYCGAASSWDPLIFKNLTKLEMVKCSFTSSSFQSNDFSSLRILTMSSLEFQEPVRFRFPSLREVEIFHCSNISFKDIMPEVTYISTSLSSEVTREVIRVAPNLKVLKVRIIDFALSSWFLNYFENPLKFLEALYIGEVDNFTGTSKYIMLDKCKYLKKIEIVYCPNLQENFFFTEISSLRFLRIQNIRQLNYSGLEKWKMFWNLEKLDILYCENMDERVFQENEFSNLKSLRLFSFNGTAKNWKQMPKLKFIYFKKVNFDDSFFYEMKQESCEKLNKILLVGNKKMTGSNWGEKELSNVKKIAFVDCDSLSDSVFSENSFPKLEELSLLGNDKITGFGWKKLGKLTTLIINSCKNFGDRFFVEHESPIKYLKLTFCSSLLKGENWKFMAGLRKIFFYKMELFAKNLMKNRPFPEDCDCVVVVK